MPQIGVLAPNQPIGARASTFIPRDTAMEMLSRLVAERISAKIIRLFPVGSVFPALKPARSRFGYIPEKLPPVELPQIRFVPPVGWTNWPVPKYVQ